MMYVTGIHCIMNQLRLCNDELIQNDVMMRYVVLTGEWAGKGDKATGTDQSGHPPCPAH